MPGAFAFGAKLEKHQIKKKFLQTILFDVIGYLPAVVALAVRAVAGLAVADTGGRVVFVTVLLVVVVVFFVIVDVAPALRIPNIN